MATVTSLLARRAYIALTLERGSSMGLSVITPTNPSGSGWNLEWEAMVHRKWRKSSQECLLRVQKRVFFTGSILTWRSGPGPLPHVKFHPYRCSDGVLDPKSENFTNFFKTKFRYKKPQRSARTVTSLRRRLTRFASLTFDSPALVFPSQNCAVFHTCHENGWNEIFFRNFW